MATSKDSDQTTKPIREINPRSAAAGQSSADTETRILVPDRDKPGAIAAAGKAGGAGDPGRTVIHRPSRPDAETGIRHKQVEYVTGWLVAVGGPGKGTAAPVFEGQNSVGRDPSQRIPLAFGDETISREGHFFITYEPKKREFFISRGTSENLVYLQDAVVLDAKPLAAGDVIEVGNTKLRFVPLCGPTFSWDNA